MAALQKEFADDALAVVAVCLGCSVEDAREGLKKANTEGILVLLDGSTETATPFHVNATPTTYIIDRDGVVQMGDVGYGSSMKARLRSEIERLLEE